jgi:hypothetical protein
VVTADGTLGAPAYAPFDRIIATCALSSVPAAWLGQCTPEALVLVPIGTGLVTLTVSDERHATGRFLDIPAFFVPLRGGGSSAPEVPSGLYGIPRDAQRQDSFHFLFRLLAGSMEPHDVYELWCTVGQPVRERYGVTIRDGRQWAWLDDPEGEHIWPLGGNVT